MTCLGSCSTPRAHRAEPSSSGLQRGAPSWVGEPEGWQKLEHIDRWLKTEARRFDAYWQLQAELALSDGRLAFAREEAGTAAAGRASWGARVFAARAGFQRVLEHSKASESQRVRARHGIAELAALEGQPSEASAVALPGGLITRSAWRAARPIPMRLTRASGGYNKITIHHTAEVNGILFDGSVRDSAEALRRVQAEHMDGRNYGDIGYHFLIDPAGRVYQGRDLRYQGAHAGGVNNRQNIGVCLLGNFENRRPTQQAVAALSRLLATLRHDHHIQRERVVCHRELKSTLCPGAHLASWTTNYRRTGPRLTSLGRTRPKVPRSTLPNASLASARPLAAASSHSGLVR